MMPARQCGVLQFFDVLDGIWNVLFSPRGQGSISEFQRVLGFEDVAFSRKESISLSVFERGQSIVGKSFGSLKRSFHGSKASSTGGATKILIEMLQSKFSWETYETRMFTASK